MPDSFGYALCMCCRDTGLTIGKEEPWAFCLCPAGQKLLADDPDAAARANAAARKIGVKS